MNKSNEIKYFKVVAMCGHVGRRKYIPIAFAIKANSAKEASQKAKGFPRVKKQCKDSILSCEEIPLEEYRLLLEANGQNDYLKARCKQDIKDPEAVEKEVRGLPEKPERRKKEERPLSEKYLRYKREYLFSGRRVQEAY